MHSPVDAQTCTNPGAHRGGARVHTAAAEAGLDTGTPRLCPVWVHQAVLPRPRGSDGSGARPPPCLQLALRRAAASPQAWSEPKASPHLPLQGGGNPGARCTWTGFNPAPLGSALPGTAASLRPPTPRSLHPSGFVSTSVPLSLPLSLCPFIPERFPGWARRWGRPLHSGPRGGPGAARFPPRLSKPLISPHLAVAARPRRGGRGHCAQECLSVPPAGRAPASCTANNAPRPGRARPEHPGWRGDRDGFPPAGPAGCPRLWDPPSLLGTLGCWSCRRGPVTLPWP